MKIKKNKKGELTTTQLVTIIVLIFSFVTLLFLIFRLDLGGTTDQEICHNSVVLKDKASIGIVESAGPLDCRTNYLCISSGEDCTEITASEKIKVDVNNKDEIMKIIADKMSSCRYMFGEDKELNYAGDFRSEETYCAICSIVEFDPKVQENLVRITYSEFYNYLEKTPKDNSQSYLKYIYGVSDLNNLEIQDAFKIVNITNDYFSTKEKYSIITGIDRNSKTLLRVADNDWLKVYVIPTTEIPETTCTEFITKA